MNYELHRLPKNDIYTRLETLLSRHIPAPIEILRTKNGKPYVAGNPVYFSVSHSRDIGVIAISNDPVGVDLEIISGKRHDSVLSRFSAREKSEISSERDFLVHWTAREAFVKTRGYALFNVFARLEYFGGNIYFDGELQKAEITFHADGNEICAVCTEKKI